MAVYERTYRSYSGDTTPTNSRFLVLPRYAFSDIFASKFFIAFLVFCYLLPLVLAVLIYIPHNLTFVKFVQALGDQLDFSFKPKYYFWAFMLPQGGLALFMALIVGPALVSSDLRNNALPLYLSRPFRRGEYILGKMATLVVLLSVITWLPGLLLFALQSYLEGFAWFGSNLRIGVAIFIGSCVWILVLSVISLALSAYMRWKPLARLALLGLFVIVFPVAGNIINFLFKTAYGSLLDVGMMVNVVWTGLFGIGNITDVPIPAAWASVAAFCAACLALLVRKVRAYEIVR